MIYLASPMASTKSLDIHKYSEKKWKRNNKIYTKLKDSGFDIFLPQENQQENATLTLRKELSVIDSSEFVIVLLSDTRGIYLETGYAFATGKKIYGVKIEETRALSAWIKGWFDYIAEDVDDLINYLKK